MAVACLALSPAQLGLCSLVFNLLMKAGINQASLMMAAELLASGRAFLLGFVE